MIEHEVYYKLCKRFSFCRNNFTMFYVPTKSFLFLCICFKMNTLQWRNFTLCQVFQEFEFLVLNDPWHFNSVFLTTSIGFYLNVIRVHTSSSTPVNMFYFQGWHVLFYYIYTVFPFIVYQGIEILADQCLCIAYSMLSMMNERHARSTC